MNKRLIKQTAAAVLLTTSVLSFSSVTYGASTTVDQSFNKVKSELNKSTTHFVYPALNGKLATIDSLYPILNSTKKNYNDVKKEIRGSKLSDKEKQAKLKELDALYNEKITKGLIPYIDAYNYATKYLDPIMKEIKAAEAKNDLAAVEKAYHKLSVQLKSRTSILYRFSGKAARDLLLDKYKEPANDKREELKVPVTIFMKVKEAQTLINAGKTEEAQKVLASIDSLVASLPNAENSPFLQTLLKEVEKVTTEVTPTPPGGGGGGGGGITEPTGNALLNAILKAQVDAGNTAVPGAVAISLNGNAFTVGITPRISTLGEFESAAKTIFDNNKSKIVVKSAIVKYGNTTISNSNVTNYTNFADVISAAFRNLGNGMSTDTELSFLINKSISFEVEGTIDGSTFKNAIYTFSFVENN